MNSSPTDGKAGGCEAELNGMAPPCGYCVQVRALEAANTKQELQIREFNEQRASTVCRDFTKYFSTINDLKAQVLPTLYMRQSAAQSR